MARTPLDRGFTFWVRELQTKSSSKDTYEESVKEIASFADVEGFFRVYDHLKRPDQVVGIVEYELFREGIKPLWEDPANRDGGRLSVRVPPQLLNRLWEEILLALVGAQFTEDVCGAVVSGGKSMIHLWLPDDNPRARESIVRKLKVLFDVPPFVPFDFRRHQPLETPAATAAPVAEPSPAPPPPSKPPAPPAPIAAPGRGRGAWRSSRIGQLPPEGVKDGVVKEGRMKFRQDRWAGGLDPTPVTEAPEGAPERERQHNEWESRPFGRSEGRWR